MLDHDLRNALYRLHTEGMGIREISRRLQISRNVIRSVIRNEGRVPKNPRKDKKTVDIELVESLYRKCDGWMQRVHEKLKEHEVDIGYSTLTRLIRDQGLGKKESSRCHHVGDVPGDEIQHDISPYRIKIDNNPTLLTASLLYFRYCKQRYLKFYRPFTRFEMKCFFYETLTHFGYTAKKCVIDNTNLARLRGTGKNAVFIPEMVAFAKRFGFEWLAHEKGHSDRKAGEERSFWFVETNFFPGRDFSSLEDLNQQALAWCAEIAKRAQTKARIIPNEAFEREKAYLKKLPPFVPEPYQEHHRDTDEYGYVAFFANYYWIPGTKREEVKVLQYRNRIRIFSHRELLIEYPLPAKEVRNERFKPEGVSTYQPRHRKKSVAIEEQKLKTSAPEIAPFLDFALKLKSSQVKRARFLRALRAMQSKMAPSLFTATIERAFKYKVTDSSAIERIAIQMLRNAMSDLTLPDTESEFEDRETYIEGRLSSDPDLSPYLNLLNEDHDG